MHPNALTSMKTRHFRSKLYKTRLLETVVSSKATRGTAVPSPPSDEK